MVRLLPWIIVWFVIMLLSVFYFVEGPREVVIREFLKKDLKKLQSKTISDGEYEIIITRKKRTKIGISITNVKLISSSSPDEIIKDLTPGTESIIRVNYTHTGRYPQNVKMTCKVVAANECSLESHIVFSQDESDKWFTFKKEKDIHQLIENGEKVELRIAVREDTLTGHLCLKIQFVDGTTNEVLTTKTKDFRVMVE